jgi:hypothetical protein
MQYKNLLKSFQATAMAAAMFIGLAPLTYAADAAENKSPNTQSESNQPPQHASPTPPAAEPESSDSDEETALV